MRSLLLFLFVSLALPSIAGAQDAPPDPRVQEIAPAPVRASRPFAIGLSGLVGTRDDGHGGLAPTWTAGLDLALDVAPWARVALRRIGYAQARTMIGDRHAIGLSPAFELSTLVAGEILEPYVQLGAAMQVRFGEQTSAVGIAPFLDGGLRIHATEWLSVSFEGALHVPVTSSFLLGHELVPQGALVLQGGLALAFHL